jgi:plasmid stabilization system protein ParE
MRVRWTDPAHIDFLQILDYIARRDPAAAARIGRRLLSAVDRLAAQPRLGRPGRLAGTRELVIPRLPYIAIYRITEAVHSTPSEVEVLRVLHGARRWPDNAG